jgi:hypothetical protein
MKFAGSVDTNLHCSNTKPYDVLSYNRVVAMHICGCQVEAIHIFLIV